MPSRTFVEAQASGDGGIENPEQNEADRDDRDDRDGEIVLKRCHAPNYRDRIALDGIAATSETMTRRQLPASS